ncbi:hypothetical protein PR048_032634 [Dryococelus australis]|uniref:Uncharacterized protein n=1 Tax=Dryococelus australis TaxID=614101 RepID=A0ABQ9G5X2_9NEOP|nr:hypothetical protein PR048_032634 [Dryococelus australis]
MAYEFHYYSLRCASAGRNSDRITRSNDLCSRGYDHQTLGCPNKSDCQLSCVLIKLKEPVEVVSARRIQAVAKNLAAFRRSFFYVFYDFINIHIPGGCLSRRQACDQNPLKLKRSLLYVAFLGSHAREKTDRGVTGEVRGDFQRQAAAFHHDKPTLPKNGAAVAERLDCSPPTKSNRVQSPAGSHTDFRRWESCRTMPLGSPVYPVLAFQRCSILISFHPHRLSRARIRRSFPRICCDKSRGDRLSRPSLLPIPPARGKAMGQGRIVFTLSQLDTPWEEGETEKSICRRPVWDYHTHTHAPRMPSSLWSLPTYHLQSPAGVLKPWLVAPQSRRSTSRDLGGVCKGNSLRPRLVRHGCQREYESEHRVYIVVHSPSRALTAQLGQQRGHCDVKIHPDPMIEILFQCCPSYMSPRKFDSSGALDVDAELEDVTNFSDDPASDCRFKALPFWFSSLLRSTWGFRFMIMFYHLSQTLDSGCVKRCISIPSENSETEPMWPHPLECTFYGSLDLRDPLGQYSETPMENTPLNHPKRKQLRVLGNYRRCVYYTRNLDDASVYLVTSQAELCMGMCILEGNWAATLVYDPDS